MEDLSTHTVPLTAVVVALQGLLFVVVVPSIWALMRRLGAINNGLAQISQWKTDHEIATAREAAIVEFTRQQLANVQDKLIDSLHRRIDDMKEKFDDRAE